MAYGFSRGSSRCRDQTLVSSIAGRLFTIWATREIRIIYIQQNAPILDKRIHKCYHHHNRHLGRSHHSRKLHNAFFPIASGSVQSLSRVWLFATPWATPRKASLSITNSRSLLKLRSIESVMPSIPFSSGLRSFPPSGSFQMTQFFASGGQSFGV